MLAEIRDFGDGKTIVLYTDNRQLANRVGNWQQCFKIVPYEQEQYSKKKVALIGLDLFLPRKLRRRLEGLISKEF